MEKTIIKVQFHTPVDGSCEWYFSSLAAIYERFTPEQIGCTLRTLWYSEITLEQPRATKRCVVSKHIVTSKPQQSKNNS